jgi:hypothetical protein
MKYLLLDKVLLKLAMITAIYGAVLVAAGIEQTYGYIVFSISSILWIYHSIRTAQEELFYTNVVFLFINLFGLWVRYDVS